MSTNTQHTHLTAAVVEGVHCSKALASLGLSIFGLLGAGAGLWILSRLIYGALTKRPPSRPILLVDSLVLGILSAPLIDISRAVYEGGLTALMHLHDPVEALACVVALLLFLKGTLVKGGTASH